MPKPWAVGPKDTLGPHRGCSVRQWTGTLGPYTAQPCPLGVPPSGLSQAGCSSNPTETEWEPFFLCSHKVQMPLLCGHHGDPSTGNKARFQNHHQRGPSERCVTVCGHCGLRPPGHVVQGLRRAMPPSWLGPSQGNAAEHGQAGSRGSTVPGVQELHPGRESVGPGGSVGRASAAHGSRKFQTTLKGLVPLTFELVFPAASVHFPVDSFALVLISEHGYRFSQAYSHKPI